MIEKVKEMMEGKTIAQIEFNSYQAPLDTLFIWFTDKTRIKVMSDPNMCFDGLAIYARKMKTVEVEEDERIA